MGEPWLGACFDRAPGEVGVLAPEAEGLIEAAEALQELARVRDVAGLIPTARLGDGDRTRQRVQQVRLVGIGLGAALDEGAVGPGVEQRGDPARGGAAVVVRERDHGRRAVARQPRLRLAVGPATPVRVRKRTASPGGGSANGGRASSSRTTITSNESASSCPASDSNAKASRDSRPWVGITTAIAGALGGHGAANLLLRIRADDDRSHRCHPRSATRLAALLAALRAQRRAADEVVVVDDGSAGGDRAGP